MRFKETIDPRSCLRPALALLLGSMLASCKGGGAQFGTPLGPNPPATEPAPQIDGIGISPDGAKPGEQMRFSVSISGGAVSSYSWVFGSGLSPSRSSSGNPLAVCALPGTYQGTLHISGPGGNASRGFEYTVSTPLSGDDAPAPSPGGGSGEPAPQIDKVIISPPPGGGVEGASVQFSLLSSGKIDSYAWDFGTGASPRSSIAARPVVRYLAPGDYKGSVAISGPGGQTGGSFDFVVYPKGSGGGSNMPPVADLKLTPARGYVPLTVQLDASGSHDPDGSIVSYEWLSGYYAPPEVSSSPLGQRSYPSPGNYSVQLHVVDNRQFRTFIEQEVIVDPWPSSNVLQAGQQAEQVSMAVLGGKPAVCFYEKQAGKLILAVNSRSDAQGSWEQHQLADFSALGLPTGEKVRLALAVIAGKPALLFNCSGYATYYAYCQDQLGKGDWELEALDINLVGSTSIASPNLCEVAGLPCIAFSGPGSTVRYGWRSSCGAGGQWSIQTVDGKAESMPHYGAQVALTSVAGRPALAYIGGPGTAELRYAHAAGPDAPGGWGLSLIAGGGWSHAACRLLEREGKPCISYGRGGGEAEFGYYREERVIALASSAAPAAPADWTHSGYLTGDYHHDISLGLLASRPVLVVGPHVMLANADGSLSDQLAHFFSTLSKDAQQYYGEESIAVLNGKLLMAMPASGNNQSRLVVVAQP